MRRFTAACFLSAAGFGKERKPDRSSIQPFNLNHFVAGRSAGNDGNFVLGRFQDCGKISNERPIRLLVRRRRRDPELDGISILACHFIPFCAWSDSEGYPSADRCA